MVLLSFRFSVYSVVVADAVVSSTFTDIKTPVCFHFVLNSFCVACRICLLLQRHQARAGSILILIYTQAVISYDYFDLNVLLFKYVLLCIDFHLKVLLINSKSDTSEALFAPSPASPGHPEHFCSLDLLTQVINVAHLAWPSLLPQSNTHTHTHTQASAETRRPIQMLIRELRSLTHILLSHLQVNDF